MVVGDASKDVCCKPILTRAAAMSREFTVEREPVNQRASFERPALFARHIPR